MGVYKYADQAEHPAFSIKLEPLLYSANPELLAYCKDGMPGWVLKLLLRYPTASDLSKAKVVSVARIPYISSARAHKLVTVAKKSVASATDTITAQLIIETVKQILHLKKIITSQIDLMAQHCSVPEVELLKSFIGINDYSAIGLISSNTGSRKICVCEKVGLILWASSRIQNKW